MNKLKSYEAIYEYIIAGHNQWDRPTEQRNTRLTRIYGRDEVAVRLHQTNIVTFYPNGDIVLANGGWYTPTTSTRMNEYLPLPWRIVSDKGQWFLTKDWDHRWPFANGITIHADGTVDREGSLSEVQARKELRRSIKQYATKFADAVVARQVGQPGAGDCMHCHWQAEGKPLGDAIESNEHLLLHIEEDYFVPSLLWNAVHEVPHAPIEEITIGILTDPNPPEGHVQVATNDYSKEYVKKGIVRILTKYLSTRLLK